MIDGFFLLGMSGIAWLAIQGDLPSWLGGHAVPHPTTGARLAVNAIALAVTLIYYPPLMRRTNGQTIGKRLLRIRVVRTDRRAMTLGRAAWREAAVKVLLVDLLEILPVVGGGVSLLVFALDVLWPLWDRENRALHDMLAGTRVTRA